MSDSLARWKALGRGPLALRFAAMGTVSGLLAWALAVTLGRLGELPQPASGQLGSAILKGIVVGTVVALALHAWWHRDETP